MLYQKRFQIVLSTIQEIYYHQRYQGCNLLDAHSPSSIVFGAPIRKIESQIKSEIKLHCKLNIS